MLKARASLSLACALMLGLGMSLAAVAIVEAGPVSSTGPIRIDLNFAGIGLTTGLGSGTFTPIGPNLEHVDATYIAPGVGVIPAFEAIVSGLLTFANPTPHQNRVSAELTLSILLDFGGGQVLPVQQPLTFLGEVFTVGLGPDASALVPGSQFLLVPSIQTVDIPGFPPITLLDHTITGIPEPASLLLLGTGLLGLGAVAWRRRRQ